MGSSKPPDPERVRAALDVYYSCNSFRQAAAETGIAERTLRDWKKNHESGTVAVIDKPFEIDPLPEELRPVKDLIKERREKFAQLDKARTARKLIPVRIPIDGPIAISHFGDPHLDDDGTDLGRIENDINIINKTEGMYAANVGDTLNNWSAKYARLWAQQSTSAKEAWQLFEWFAHQTRWLYFLDGNHGLMQGDNDPAQFILRNVGGIHAKMSAEINLVFPNKREVRINASHMAPGGSMYNPAHGAAAKARKGWDDHIIIAGHNHTSGYSIFKSPKSGVVSHCIRVASYKIWDRYAEESELEDQAIFSNAVTIIDPAATSEINLVHVMFDVAEASAFLKWRRKRK